MRYFHVGVECGSYSRIFLLYHQCKYVDEDHRPWLYKIEGYLFCLNSIICSKDLAELVYFSTMKTTVLETVQWIDI